MHLREIIHVLKVLANISPLQRFKMSFKRLEKFPVKLQIATFWSGHTMYL